MPKKTRDLSEFRAQFDKGAQIRQRIKVTLSALLKQGPEEWRSEREICTLARVSTKDIPEVRADFAAHLVTVPSANAMKNKTIWFANPKVAAKVRQ